MPDIEPPPLPTLPAAECWALFLDIDGTLLDLATQPDQVTVPASVPALLQRWCNMLRGAVALISGRDLNAIDRLFRPYRFVAAGSHGLQWRLGRRSIMAGPDRAADLAAVRSFAVEKVNLFPGMLLEEKSHGLAVHYGGVPEHHDAAWAVARSVMERLGAGFQLMSGKSSVEIVVNGVCKGQAIERFMACPPYAGRRAVYFGDDVTDESGFAVVNRLDGLSVRVGSGRQTEARHQLPSPGAVLQWLASPVIP
jgi:trehalose 6-phosphate phosphatase